MKNTSIRKRVTLYYSLALILTSTILLGILITSVDFETSSISKKTLQTAVVNSFDEIEYENKILEIDNDFNSYSKGVILLVYSENGDLIKGSIPSHFPSKTPLTTGTYQEIEESGHSWLVYDLHNTYENNQALWIRGIYAMDNAHNTLLSIIHILIIVFPILLIIAIFAGYKITKKAFAPIGKLTASANTINNGQDLSKRLPQGETKDELYYLTETLNLMLERLETAFNAENTFAYDVSHELKTPITVILTECEYILAENRSPDIYRESLENINDQCKRTMSLIQQLLQLSRTINTSSALELEEVDLSLLCQGAVEELSKVASKNNVTIESDIGQGIMYKGDETLIIRMIINLLSNGIKYSKDENGYVKLSLSRDVDSIIIKVEDNGIGIAEEEQSLIFNKFYKSDKSRKADENSYGLGLSMVKWIVEAHGGTINLESQLSKGSVFTINL